MIKAHAKYLAVLVTVIGLLLNFTTPILAQNFPHWGNHEPPGGTGNTLPPYSNETFVRQDPMPDSMQGITILESTNKHIIFSINFPNSYDYEMVEDSQSPDEYIRFKADNRFQITAKEGEAEILCRKLWLQVPLDAENLKFSVIEEKRQARDLNAQIYPSPKHELETLRQGLEHIAEVFYKSESWYSQDSWLPEYSAHASETGIQHGMKMIDVRIPVFNYNPIQKNIQFLKSITIRLDFESQNTNNYYLTYKDNPFHSVFNSLIPNYRYKIITGLPDEGRWEEVSVNDLTNPDYDDENDFRPNFLLICSEEFRDSQAKKNWLKHRCELLQDHRVAVAYTHDIYQAYEQSGSPQESIRDFVQFVYNNWKYTLELHSLNYLLLVGDADYSYDNGSWFLPTWRTSEPHVLKGNSGDNDYAWIEGNDTLDDVMIGRLPAQSDDELMVMVHKIILFEQRIPHEKNHFGTRHLFMAGDTFAEGTFSNPARTTLITHHQEQEEYNARYFPFGYKSEEIIKLLNTKGALFVSYNGHGEPAIVDDWTGWLPGVFPDQLTNLAQLPLLTLSLACNTGRFDYSYEIETGNYIPYPSFGELWLKNPVGGSVCFFGSTRIAYGSSQAGQLDFYQEIYDRNNYSLGAVLTVVKNEMSDYLEYIHRKIYCLLGDPSIRFDNYIGESSKPDFKITKTVLNTPPPEFYGQECVFTSKIYTETPGPYSVDFQLMTLNRGEVDPLGALQALNMELPIQSVVDRWDYKGQSGMHLMAWIDPYNKIDELNEYNNHACDREIYFPFYLDKENSSGEQFGTSSQPFGKLKDAIIAVQENNTISPEDRKTNSSLHLYIGKGVYGNGETHTLDQSISLKGMGEKPEDHLIFDNFICKGSFYQIENLTFDGEKSRGNLLSFDTKDSGRYSSKAYLTNNILRQSKESAVYSSALMRRLDLFNNIIHNNKIACYTDFLNNNGANEYTLQRYVYFNTITQNLTNFASSEAPNSDKDEFNFRFNSNIIYNNGESIFPPQTLEENIKIKFLQYSDVDDEILISNAEPTYTIHNINKDPRFMGSLIGNFHLKPTSPCIDTGSPAYTDPDGSPADIGAYGGDQAIMRPIKITYPVHENTIYVQQTWNNLFDINIQWNAHSFSSHEIMRIQISHWEDTGLVEDIDELAPNSGGFQATICQFPVYRNYFLTISSNENPEIREFIKFKMSKQIDPTLQMNR